MKRLLFLSALAAAAGCTDQGVATPAVLLVNNSHGSFIYVALEAEVANLVDLIDTAVVARSRDRLIASGESRVIAVEGYSRGKDIRLFIYRLATPDAAKAGLDTGIHVPDRWLRQVGYRITVTN